MVCQTSFDVCHWLISRSVSIGPITWFKIKGDRILVLSDPADAEELVCFIQSHHFSRIYSSLAREACDELFIKEVQYLRNSLSF